MEILLGLPKPIADLYPNTTVLSADIAGFTAWSRKENPNKCSLSKYVYHGFDMLQLGACDVFKVGTIGDHYVAVTAFP
jgi:hypothetical protein